MTTKEMKKTIRRWFRKAEQATGPILPDGWFGRPYDNTYWLQDVEVEGDTFTVRLNEDTALVFKGLTQVCVRNGEQNAELVFEDFTHLMFRWKLYGGTEYRERHYDGGQVRFLPPLEDNYDTRRPE